MKKQYSVGGGVKKVPSPPPPPFYFLEKALRYDFVLICTFCSINMVLFCIVISLVLHSGFICFFIKF